MARLRARAYLDFLQFWGREILDEVFDLLSFCHEVVHEFLLVGCNCVGVCVRKDAKKRIIRVFLFIYLRTRPADQLYQGCVVL